MDPSPFSVEFSKKAAKDLRKLPSHARQQILRKSKLLVREPFRRGKSVKKIKGMNFPCYRLTIDTEDDSYRLFYGIEGDKVLVLRVVSKKRADRIIRTLRQ